MKIPKILSDNLLVEEEEAQESTLSGVFLPQLRTFRQREGTVLAVGPGRLLPDHSRLAMSAKVGDRVIYDATAGVVITKDGLKEFVVLSERAVVAVISEDGE